MTRGPARWSTEENMFLMTYAYKIPWPLMAAKTGHTELACRKQYEKIMKLRKASGTWRGI